MKILVFIIVTVFLTSCVSVKYNGSESKVTNIDYPEINVEVTAFVGDQLISKGKIIEESAITISHAKNANSVTLYTVTPGTYKQIGYDDKMLYFSPEGIVKSALADTPLALVIKRDDTSKLYAATPFSIAPMIGEFKLDKITSEVENSFKQTLIYSGLSNDSLLISYREFSNNYARSAFNHDVEYDLSKSKIIGYKGARLEILRFDNVSITYKLLSNFK